VSPPLLRTAAALAALAALGAAPALAGEEACGVCHGAERVQHARSVHPEAAVGCVTCHGGDPARADSKEAAHAKEKGFTGKVSRARAVETCGACHADVARMRPYGLRADVLEAYRDSHHGRAVLGKEDPDAATCVDCHGAHEVLRVRDPASPSHRGRVPATCGRCHGDEAMMKRHGIPADAPRDYAGSVHGLRHAEGRPGVPTCADCHDAHAATPPGAGEVSATCGRCHAEAAEMFRRSPHFAASREGRMGQCTACHGNHAVSRPGFALFDAPAAGEDGNGAGTRCLSCHDPADREDRGSAVAASFGRGFREATAARDAAAARVDAVARLGFFVDDERASLEEARRELVRAVPLTHTADPVRVEAALRRARSFVAEALAGADGKVRERRDRRILGTFGAVVLLGLSGFLALRRRRAAAGSA
jgi:hypothetical protein